VGLPVRPGAVGRGDYLIRAFLGGDRTRGQVALGDRIATGQQVRLHVRDAGTAREDLEMLLSPQVFDTPARAALLFACSGRGRGLYGAADGDIGPLQAALGGGVPVAGMFCAGEIGPVGERNFVHWHTASIAIIRPVAPPR
jgi:small ligand-binding sensory domain FIST